MAAIASAVTTMFPTVTASTVTDGELISTGSVTLDGGRDTSGTVGNSDWDLRDSADTTSTSVTYTAWDDWTGNWFRGGASSNNQVVPASVVQVDIGTASATFNVSMQQTDLGNSVVRLDSIVNQTGTPGTCLLYTSPSPRDS